MMKRGDISKEFYQKVRPVGSQPARLYGLAKVHKKESPLRPILSLPDSQYEKPSKELAEIIKKLPEAGIRTDRKKVLQSIQSTNMEEDEIVVSLYNEGLFTSVPLDEAIELTVYMSELAISRR